MLQPNAQVIAHYHRIGLSTSILTIKGLIQVIPKGRTKNSTETRDKVTTDDTPILSRRHPWYIK